VLASASSSLTDRSTTYSVENMRQFRHGLGAKQSPIGNDVNTEAEILLGSVTRQWPVKTQQTEKPYFVL
jgi:hypothetical protein